MRKRRVVHLASLAVMCVMGLAGSQDPQSVTQRLIQAVKAGRLLEVRRCLDEGANPNIFDSEGRPVIFNAEKLDVARALVASGANLYAKDRKGRTLLHEMAFKVWASGEWWETLDVLKYGLRMGLDPHVRDNAGESALAFMRRRFCNGYLHWDKETLLLLEEKGSPLLAKDEEQSDASFPGPHIVVAPVGESEYKASFSPGYRWLPTSKELLTDGRIRLGYDGRLGNPHLMQWRSDLNYDSCRLANGHWLCAAREGGGSILVKTPNVRLAAIEGDQYTADRPEEAPVLETKKSHHSDGDTGLSLTPAEIKHTSFSLVISAEYDFHSCKMQYGSWVCRKRP